MAEGLTLDVTWASLGLLALLVLGSTLAVYCLFNVAIRPIPIGRATVLALIEMPLVMLWGRLFPKETMSGAQRLGAALILLSVLLALIRPQTATAVSEGVSS